MSWAWHIVGTIRWSAIPVIPLIKSGEVGVLLSQLGSYGSWSMAKLTTPLSQYRKTSWNLNLNASSPTASVLALTLSPPSNQWRKLTDTYLKHELPVTFTEEVTALNKELGLPLSLSLFVREREVMWMCLFQWNALKAKSSSIPKTKW